MPLVLEPQHPATPACKRLADAWLWAGFMLIALNLRLIFASVGPLLANLALGFTSTLLVTTLPLLLLGLFSIPGVLLRRKLGEERALFLALVLLTGGCGLRGCGETGLILGTLMGGAGIAVMNVIMPALARKRFGPQRMGMVMGLYALMLGAGAVLGASASLPVFQTLGGTVASAYHTLGLWAAPALLALLIWLPQLQHGPAAGGGPRSSATPVQVYRHPTAWAITLFFGLQALNLYVFLAWMPVMLMDRGATPSAASMIFAASQLSLMVGSFVTPLLAARRPDQRACIVITVLSCLAGTLGLSYAPAASTLVWAVVLGFGQGAGPALGAYLFIAKAKSLDTATRLSAIAQTLGYLIAMAGPLLIGTIYQRTGDWQLPTLILASLLLVELILALPAGRDIKL